MSIPLIRYANEGFVNYEHPYLNKNEGDKIIGCSVFIEQENKDALIYNYTYLKHKSLLDRTNHTRHEVLADKGTMIYIPNIQIKKGQRGRQNNDEFYWEVSIAEEKIFTNLSEDTYVPVPLAFASKRLSRLVKIRNRFEYYDERLKEVVRPDYNIELWKYYVGIVSLVD